MTALPKHGSLAADKALLADSGDMKVSGNPGLDAGKNRRQQALLKTISHVAYVLKSNVVPLIAFILFFLLILAAVLGPWITPYDPLQTNTAMALKAPSMAHWFGTDQLGRDVFSRVVA